MKLICKNKQHECINRLIAIRKIADDIIDNTNKNKRVLEDYNYLIDNIIEIARIVDGFDASLEIIAEMVKESEEKLKQFDNKIYDTFTDEFIDEENIEISAPPERYVKIKTGRG